MKLGLLHVSPVVFVAVTLLFFRLRIPRGRGGPWVYTVTFVMLRHYSLDFMTLMGIVIFEAPQKEISV